LSEEKQEIARFVRQTQISYPVLIDGDSISAPTVAWMSCPPPSL